TLGGGRIADVNPRLHHRFRAQSLSWLRALDEGSPDQILLTAARSDRPVGVAMLMGRCGLAADQAQAALARLLETAQLVELDGALLTATAWTAVAARIRTELEDYHRRFPLRPGIPRDELRSRIGWAAKPFNAAVNRWMAEGVMAAQAPSWRRADSRSGFRPRRKAVHGRRWPGSRKPRSPLHPKTSSAFRRTRFRCSLPAAPW